MELVAVDASVRIGQTASSPTLLFGLAHTAAARLRLAAADEDLLALAAAPKVLGLVHPKALNER
jgi:hypothetical protein